MENFLVNLANQSEVVRDYLNVKDWDNIVKITPNSVHRFVGILPNGDYQFQARFVTSRKDLGVTNILMRFAHDSQFKRLEKNLDKKQRGEFWGSYYKYQERELKMGKLAFLTGSFNPDADPETSSVDGRVRRNTFSTGESWSSQRTGAGNGTSDNGTTGDTGISTTGVTNNWGEDSRGFYLFDTSSLDDGAVISAADVDLYITTVTDNFTEDAAIVATNPASNTALVNADYSTVGTTDYSSRVTLASMTTSAYNTFTLNASGIAAIDVTGITKLGSRIGASIDDTEPTWASNNDSKFRVQMADAGSNAPRLDVTYTIPTRNPSANMLLGIG